jgi:hypothetical protein
MTDQTFTHAMIYDNTPRPKWWRHPIKWWRFKQPIIGCLDLTSLDSTSDDFTITLIDHD